MTRKNALNVCNSFLKELSQIDCGIFMESQNKTYFGEFEKITFFDGDGAIKHCDVDLADISPAALKVAEDNRKRLGLNNIKIIDSDMFSNIDETYDIIVSNPPYIPTGDIDSLEPEVRNSEPVSALDGSKDGLKFYRILANKGAKYLKCGGSIFLEIGYNQAEDVKSLLENNKFADVRVIKDLAGLDRVVCGRRM